MRKILYFISVFVLISVLSVVSLASSEKVMQYDDYYTIDNTFRIISQKPAVGSNVIEITDNGIHAIGLGTAVIESGGEEINVKVEKSSVHIALMMGQSNSGNNCGNIEDAIECEKGIAYYWDSVSKSQPDALIRQKHYRSSFTSEWYKLSSLNGSPEKVAIVHVAGSTYVDGVSITSDSPYDQRFGWINKTESGYILSAPGKTERKSESKH